VPAVRREPVRRRQHGAVGIVVIAPPFALCALFCSRHAAVTPPRARCRAPPGSKRCLSHAVLPRRRVPQQPQPAMPRCAAPMASLVACAAAPVCRQAVTPLRAALSHVRGAHSCRGQRRRAAWMSARQPPRAYAHGLLRRHAADCRLLVPPRCTAAATRRLPPLPRRCHAACRAAASAASHADAAPRPPPFDAAGLRRR